MSSLEAVMYVISCVDPVRWLSRRSRTLSLKVVTYVVSDVELAPEKLLMDAGYVCTVEIVKPAIIPFCLQRDRFLVSTFIFRSVVFLIGSLLFKFFRLKVPGREIDSGDDGRLLTTIGKGS